MKKTPPSLFLVPYVSRTHTGVTANTFPDESIDHFAVVRLVAWPLNESEAGADLVLIETSLLFLC